MARSWIFIISLFVLGCQSNENQKDLLSKDMLKSVLIDIQSLQSLDTFINSSDTLALLNQVLLKHNINNELYEKTLLFYLNHPEDLVDIVNEARDSLFP